MRSVEIHSSRSVSPRKFYTLIALVAALAALFALLTTLLVLNAFHSDVARRTWTKTSGTIAAVPALAPCSSGPPQEEVRYSYFAGGAAYSVQYGVRCTKKERKRLSDARFQPGASATVYFNPQQPDQSWLDTGPADVRSGLTLTGGMAFLTGGLCWMLVAAVRRRRRIGRLLLSDAFR